MHASTKGIGLKTASALLNHFGTVETMYERLGLPSIIQSLHNDEQTALLDAMEGKDGDSSSSSSRQSTTTTTSPAMDINSAVILDDDDGDGDVAGSSVDTRAVDALFARINAVAALNKKVNKKTPKSKKKGGLVSEEEDEGGVFLVEVTEEQRLVASALAQLEISLQGVCASVSFVLVSKIFLCMLLFDTVSTCSDYLFA